MSRVPLRVLVADDSPTARRRLIEALTADADFEVVGEASNGEEAIARCAELHPDVVMLDLEMSRLDGVRVTEAIMTTRPTPILIVSADDPRSPGVQSAIAAGAVDALAKRGPAETDAAFDLRLLRAVRLVSKVRVITRRVARPVTAVTAADPQTRRELVAIGGSTGGPSAVVDLLKGLPRDFPAPILLVLHLGASFGYGFSEWLGSVTPLRVVEAVHGAALTAGVVHVCPPDRHLVLRGDRIALTSDPERHFCRPSVDVLFESVAAEVGAAAIGCLLTGIGRDGAAGLLRMRQAGALTLAQDESSSTVYGMPRAAMELGAVTFAGSPTELAARLTSAVRVRRDPTGTFRR